MVCAMLQKSDNWRIYIAHLKAPAISLYYRNTIYKEFTNGRCLRRMNCRMVAAAVLLVVVMGCMRVSEGQELPACATNVVPCMDFLNLTTKPPASCCDPLSRAVVKQLSCLCNLYTTPSFFESYSINFTLAIRLPSLCGISTDLTTCLGGGKNGTTSPIPASLAPPGNNEDDNSTKNNVANSSENIAHRNELSVLLLSLLLLWVSSSVNLV
ncbi:non-specific lipid transfer protein GPI-anchored 7 [Daucus carota subsp. sativus]|uniref:non-specific lipid transfer protein GPI-anchored 7 n=1 Tax=Daucus carota subsp. sativus TaxID=79200 RepID=UPI0007F02C33|nr:PREDICTED: xylogen-like protein 11 isoform X1 [Daucus carota subsp. sativus]